MSNPFGITMKYSTTDHPLANRLVEKFHCHMTTTFNGSNWIDQLLWMMLGICSTPKENLNISSMEMVYGASLTAPGEFLPNTKSDTDIKQYLMQLRNSVSQLHPIPMSTHSTPRSSTPNEDLHTSNFMFIQCDPQ